jgi:hypothetical protein
LFVEEARHDRFSGRRPGKTSIVFLIDGRRFLRPQDRVAGRSGDN